MAKTRNTVAELELIDGTTVKTTLTYGSLYALRAKDRKAYDRYNEIMRKKNDKREELDNVGLLYTAYLCNAVKDVSANKDAFDSWVSSEIRKARERR